jgi:hypothetical protein
VTRLLLALLALAPTAFAADIGISPPRLDLTAAAGETVVATVTVLTSALAEQQVEAAPADWTLDLAGQLTVLAVGSGLHSATPWVELDTDAFTLPALGSREVRIAVTVPADATLSGTHHTMLFFSVVPAPNEAQGFGVVTTTRVGLTLYLTIAGTEVAGSELVDLYQEGDGSLTAVVLNTGNTTMRLAGAVELRDESGAVRYRLEVPDVPVLRESERAVTFDLPAEIEPGLYVALALIEDSRGGVLAGELLLEVP